MEQIDPCVNDRMPSLFLSHGAPTLPIEESPARDFFLNLGKRFPQPKAILIASAHWISDKVEILGGDTPLDTIYDFYGFPQALYEMTYPAPGISSLAENIGRRLKESGFEVSIDRERGLDHGAWIPLKLMYPDANIPVAQISVNPRESAEYHWRLGKVLANLKQQGILIIGSGTMTHNLGEIADFHNEQTAASEAQYVTEFSRWMENTIKGGEVDKLLQYRQTAPHAKRAHPTPEHILPFFVALGAAGSDWDGELLHRSCTYGVINLDSYAFRPVASMDVAQAE